MDTEDFVHSEQSANTAETFTSNNDHQQVVQFIVQGQTQLNEISQQEPTTAAESITGVAPVVDNQNSENVTTYYFRDSEQSEWSSSSSEDEEKHDQSVPSKEIEEEEGEQGEVADKKKKKKKNNRVFADDFLEEDEGMMVDPKGENMKTKNEIIKVPVYEKEETGEERLIRYGVQFKGTERMVEIGTVLSIVDDKLIVATHNEAREEDKRLILDLDNMIFDENKQLIGLVDDVFGNIKSPFYAVTMDVFLKELVKSKTIALGNRMYMIEGFNKILMKAQLEFMMKQKGCDASNRFDEEVLMDNEREFSDDELESRSKQKKQNNERKQDLTEIEDLGVDNVHEAVIPPHGDNQGGSSAKKPNKNKNKKIMVMKNENGVLKRLFLKPSEFETLKNNPNNRIQQLPSSSSQNSFRNQEQQQQQYPNPRFNNNSRQNNNNTNNNQRFNNNFSQNNNNQRNHNFHQSHSNNGNNYQQQNPYGQPYQQQQPMQMQQQQQQFQYQQNQQQIYPNTQQQQYQQQQQQQTPFFVQRQNPSYAPPNYPQQSIPQQAFIQEHPSNIPNQSANYPRNQDGQ